MELIIIFVLIRAQENENNFRKQAGKRGEGIG
jgi:hypothetical protein